MTNAYAAVPPSFTTVVKLKAECPAPHPPGDNVQEYWDALEEFFENDLPSHFESAREWIACNCSSYEKLPAVLHLHGQMEFCEWLALLGEFWTGFDNIGGSR